MWNEVKNRAGHLLHTDVVVYVSYVRTHVNELFTDLSRVCVCIRLVYNLLCVCVCVLWVRVRVCVLECNNLEYSSISINTVHPIARHHPPKKQHTCTPTLQTHMHTHPTYTHPHTHMLHTTPPPPPPPIRLPPPPPPPDVSSILILPNYNCSGRTAG